MGCGESRGTDFPLTYNALQNYSGGTADSVVFELDSNGVLIFSTYIGGKDYDALTHIVVNRDNTIWATGRTRSSNFPLTSNANDKSLNEEYETPLIQLDHQWNLLYSSYFGGSTSFARTLGDVIDVMPNGNVVVAGYSNSTKLPVYRAYQNNNNGDYDSFIAVFDSLYKTVWCTYKGGSLNDYGSQLAVDKYNNVYLMHYVNSYDMPIVNPTLKSF